MPIRFRCKRCYQMLGIASRKAGAEIACPKCGFSQTVPSEEAAAAALAMDQFGRGQVVAESASDLVVYDDAPTAIETPRPRREPSPAPAASSDTRTAEAGSKEKRRSSGGGKPTATGQTSDRDRGPAQPAPTTPAAPEPEDSPVEGAPVPRGMILFPRRTFYVQGVLFLVLAGVSFAAGYFMGRGDARLKLQEAQEELSKVRVLVEGTLVYQPGPNQVEPDERAVVMALPLDKFPEKKLTIQGIRPSDREPPPSHPTVRQIRELGGTYARADEEGTFDMIVPDKGTYRVLVISAHARRPKESDIHEPDLEQLGKYFTQPDVLIGRHKYRFTEEEIDSGFNPIEIDFGRDERE
jgi:phage FluMu protein Com